MLYLFSRTRRMRKRVLGRKKKRRLQPLPRGAPRRAAGGRAARGEQLPRTTPLIASNNSTHLSSETTHRFTQQRRMPIRRGTRVLLNTIINIAGILLSNSKFQEIVQNFQIKMTNRDFSHKDLYTFRNMKFGFGCTFSMEYHLKKYIILCRSTQTKAAWRLKHILQP